MAELKSHKTYFQKPFTLVLTLALIGLSLLLMNQYQKLNSIEKQIDSHLLETRKSLTALGTVHQERLKLLQALPILKDQAKLLGATNELQKLDLNTEPGHALWEAQLSSLNSLLANVLARALQDFKTTANSKTNSVMNQVRVVELMDEKLEKQHQDYELKVFELKRLIEQQQNLWVFGKKKFHLPPSSSLYQEKLKRSASTPPKTQ